MFSCPLCRYQTKLFHVLERFSYYLCSNCLTLTMNPLPSDQYLNKYYQKEFDYQTGLSQEKSIRKRSKIVLKKLKKLNPQGQTLLDIGSAAGFFLDEAKKAGLQTTGIEPTKHFNISIYQNKIYNITFDEYFISYKNNCFDFITAIHVIEHLKNPKEFLFQALSLLNQNGVLFIETPNLDSHLFWKELKNYTFLTPPEHLYIYSKKSFNYLLSKSAQIVNASTYSYPSHFMGIIKKSKIQLSPSLKLRRASKIQKFEHSNLEFIWDLEFMISNLKFLVFDRFFAPLFTPLLNIGGKGSILELYIKKKS